jgi:ubiquinone/menaquinone biosynthesis C-methylase UbiE
MSLWKLERVPEPEEMDDAEEVASYSSAAAERHLDAIDDTLVEHLSRLLGGASPGGVGSGWGLDVGTGPAQIPVKILARFPSLRIVALDRSPNMLACARQNAERAGVLHRLALLRSDGHRLPFADALFSFVLCNSVLHHARDPAGLLRELFRVTAPGAAVLIRDLRRPARPLLRWHQWRHGRNYHGRMRQLFDASVRAAYTVEELRELLREAGVANAPVFRLGGAHLGVERPAHRGG